MTREEAIETIRMCCPKVGDSQCDFESALRELIPELAESVSEDERTRRELVKFISDIKSISESGRTSWAIRSDDAKMCETFLAYLEKQKELFKSGKGLYYYDGEKTTYYSHFTIEENPYDFAMSQQEVKQKEQNGGIEECTDFTIYHPLKNGKGEYECIPYSFYGSLTSFSEDKDLIDFLRTCFYTKEECNEWIERQKEQKPISEVFGFKVGDAVRLKNGDGRKHIIKSIEEVEGIHGPNFYHVEFEDNSARDGIYPGEEYPNGYYTQMEKIEEEQKLEEEDHITPNKKFFQWIYDRLVFIHGENPDVDYMRSLKDRIKEMSSKQKSAEVDESTKRLNENWMKQYFDDYKEQKPAEYIKRNSKEGHALLAEQYDKGFWKGKAEQKPAELSEDDEDMIVDIIDIIQSDKAVAKIDPDYPASQERLAYYDKEITFLKSLLEGVKCRLKTEWSEEDDKAAYFINQFLEYHEASDPTAKSCKEWFNNRLKSLRPDSYKNCNSRWKPSEEQMRAVFDASERNDKLGSVLRNLYDDLRKLI